jgi:hypothetical protein
MGGPVSEARPSQDTDAGNGSLYARLAALLGSFDTIHITVLGLALYVTVYFSYSIFYGPIRRVPDRGRLAKGTRAAVPARRSAASIRPRVPGPVSAATRPAG